VETVVLPIRRRRIGVRFARDLADPDDRLRIGARVVEEDAIAALHAVAEKIARRVVAYAVPLGGLLWGRAEVVEGEHAGLGLDQPIPFLVRRARREDRRPPSMLVI